MRTWADWCPTFPGWVTVILMLGLLLGACGDDNGAAVDGTEAPDEVAGPDGVVAPDPERFCEIYALLQVAPDLFVEPADEARTNARGFVELQDESFDVAPGDIRSSVETTVNAYKTVVAAFENLDYDVNRLTDVELEAISTEEFQKALDVVDSWVEANC